jgi:hypothetical protein
MKCVNISHPDYQRKLKEAEKYGYAPALFEMETAIWQNKNKVETYPVIEMIDTDLGNLINFTRQSGIRLESLEWWQEVTGNKLADDVQALADPMRNAIAYRKGNLTKEMLSEELVHIMLAHSEYEKDPDFDKILSYVERTDQYKKNYAKYLEKYEGDEIKAKKEILHQIGSRVLLKDMKVQKGTLLSKYLKKLWNKFLALFDVNIRLELYLEDILNEVDLKNPVQDKNIYYSLADVQIENEIKSGDIKTASKNDIKRGMRFLSEAEREIAESYLDNFDQETIYKRKDSNGKVKFYNETDLKDYIKNQYKNTIAVDPAFMGKVRLIKQKLRARSRKLARRQELTDTIKQSIKTQLQDLDLEKISIQRGVGLSQFITHVMQDSQKVLSYLTDTTGKYKLTDETLNQIMEFYGHYKPILKDLQEYLNIRINELENDTIKRTKNDLPLVGERELLELTQQALNAFASAEASLNWKLQNLAIDTVRQSYIEELSISTETVTPSGQVLKKNNDSIDREINKILFGEDESSKDYIDYREIIKGTKDVYSVERYTGSGRYASDPILRLVNSILGQAKIQSTRETSNFVKDLDAKLKQFKFNNYDFALETLDDGKATGYLMGRIHKGKFEKAKAEFFEKLYNEHNIPKSGEERMLYKERMEDINRADPDSLLESQKAELKNYKEYKSKLNKWYSQNTMPKKDANKIMALAQKELNPYAFAEWKKQNIGYYYHNGQLKKYWKGDMVEPSDGSTIKHDKYGSIKTNDYTNKKWNSLSQEQRDFIEFYKNEKKKIDDVLPGNTPSDMMIPIREDMMGAVIHRNKHLFQRIKGGIKSEFFTDEDDTLMFGDPESIQNADTEFVMRGVPVHHNKKLKDPNLISRDLVGALVEYARVGKTYQNRKKIIKKIQVIEQQYARRTVDGKKGVETNAYKLLQTGLDINLSDKPKKKVEFMGFNITKAFEKINSYTRSVNLMGNLGSIFSSAVTARVNALQEGIMDYYISRGLQTRAMKIQMAEMVKNGMDGLSKVKKAKLNVMAESAGLMEITKNFDRGVLLRESLGWAPYTIPSHILSSRLLIALTLDIKKDENGNWVSKAFYKGDNWDNLPNLYENITVDKTGKMVLPKGAEKIWNQVSLRAQDLVARVEGQLSPQDKTYLHQHYALASLTLHRSFLFRVFYDRLKKRGYDPMTGDYDEGYWLSAFRDRESGKPTLKKLGMFFRGNLLRSAAQLEMWEQLTPSEKYGVKMVLTDTVRAIGIFMLAGMIHGMADDDEDLELLSYLTNKAAVEIGSSLPILNPGEFITVLQNPVASLKYAEYMLDITQLFSGEEISRGPFEGMTERERFIIRFIPVIKGLFNLRDPKSINQFIVNKQLNNAPFAMGEYLTSN